MVAALPVRLADVVVAAVALEEMPDFAAGFAAEFAAGFVTRPVAGGRSGFPEFIDDADEESTTPTLATHRSAATPLRRHREGRVTVRKQ